MSGKKDPVCHIFYLSQIFLSDNISLTYNHYLWISQFPDSIVYIRTTLSRNIVTGRCNSNIIIMYTTARVLSISSMLMREPVTQFTGSTSVPSSQYTEEIMSELSWPPLGFPFLWMVLIPSCVKVVTLLKLPCNICACYSSESIIQIVLTVADKLQEITRTPLFL